ncbi:hypothetical protein SNE25_11430 [Mucilaginibacter sabulilitoris]|uniref:Uncharacterized protein n=1 Tax=Mucilaginibacter sabulilitoris TaxID=1173583 RepID=A0ABZ0TSP2_9SPHI|nr:hypothetical protein [Mucilaginibacter sabulilitoris]WPU96131.1 hypothetical protein SNE25_11430 [Mucilaginibacter sabulilitoris]
MKMKNLMMPLVLILCALVCGTVQAKDAAQKQGAITAYYSFEDIAPTKATNFTDVPCNLTMSQDWRDTDWIITFSQNGHEVYSFSTPYYHSWDNIDGYENLGNVAEGTYDITFTTSDSTYPFHYLVLPDGTDKDYADCYVNGGGYTFHNVTITAATGCELMATPDLE